MTNFLKGHGVCTTKLSVADAHQQNSVAERMNRTIMDRVHSMLSESGVSQKLWAEAVHTTVYVRNRCPTSSLPNNLTPYEAWYGTKPSVKHLRVFGCLAYAHIPLKQRTKLDPKSEDCTFVGYDDDSKGYRLFSHKRHSVIIRRDVTFNDSHSRRRFASQATCNS